MIHATHQFVMTAAEQSFLHHFNRETCHAERGPAIDWLARNHLPGRAMSAFQYWAERNDDAFMERALFDPLPPFEAPWASRDEFVSRVHEILAICPELGSRSFAQP